MKQMTRMQVQALASPGQGQGHRVKGIITDQMLIHTYVHPHTHTHLHTHHTHTYTHTYIHNYIPTYLHTYLHTYIHTYIPTYLPTYIHTHIRTHTPTPPPHTYIHTYLHTYLPTYLHTYIHTYIHTYTCIHTHIHAHIPVLSGHNSLSQPHSGESAGGWVRPPFHGIFLLLTSSRCWVNGLYLKIFSHSLPTKNSTSYAGLRSPFSSITTVPVMPKKVQNYY